MVIIWTVCLERQDFLEPRGTNPQPVLGADPMAEVWDSELWRTFDEYGDVNILIRDIESSKNCLNLSRIEKNN